jgi:uncharacterized protein (TIGR00288 family)
MENKRVAVFIDAENLSADYAELIRDHAASYGDIAISRVFADWTNDNSKSWHNKSKELAFKQEQQAVTVKGKNTNDIALVIRAMSTLIDRNIDVYVIVSNDSDFIGLAQELKEREKLVIGLGVEGKVSKPYENSFNEFIYLRNDKKSTQILSVKQESDLETIIEKLIQDNNGKAAYSLIATEMKNKSASFTYKNFGYSSFGKFMEDILPKHLKKYKKEISSDKSTIYLLPQA